jgi:hypothetical protein
MTAATAASPPLLDTLPHPARDLLDSPRYSMRQTAARCGVHVVTLWRWTTAGVRGHRLPSYILGGRRFVRARDLDLFIQLLQDARPEQAACRDSGA